MKNSLIVLSVVALAAISAAYADHRVTYVGDGRYTCSGNSAQCAQIDANNRQREVLRDIERQREDDRLKRVIDENRKREEEAGRRK